MDTEDKVALLDLDSTVADYDAEMARELAKLRGPGEPDVWVRGEEEPAYIHARRDLIKYKPGFWRGLPRIQLGFEVVDLLREIGFDIVVLTKGNGHIPGAWSEKFEWCREHLPFAEVTVTQRKSLSYGRVLVDDFPEYFESWLAVRPRGLVIAVAQPWNAGVRHPRLIRYTGRNLDEVRTALVRAYNRQPGEPL